MASKAAILIKLQALLNNLESPEEENFINKVVNSLPEEFRDGFRRFVDDFEADVNFLAYWETNESCQNALRELMNQRIGLIEQVVGIMKELIA